jgi:alpha,alpha-trehalase
MRLEAERLDDRQLARAIRPSARSSGANMIVIDLARFDAFAFDLDGVVTKTAAVHAAAWKRPFDELLERLARGKIWEPFDLEHEYRTYVDGKPRRDGIRSFLAARRISLPDGNSGDRPEANTIYGLAVRKNRYFLDHLAAEGVHVHQDALLLISRARSTASKRRWCPRARTVLRCSRPRD